MTGFGRRKCGFRGFKVTHLTNQNDIGILSQRAFKRNGEAVGIEPDLTLIDDALAVAVQIFDRVFDGDDMFGALTVDVVEHCRQGGRFSGACCAGYQNQPTLFTGNLFEDFW